MSNETQRLTDRITELRLAFTEIKTEGHVCINFGLCKHSACSSSYASWHIADVALKADDKAVQDAK